LQNFHEIRTSRLASIRQLRDRHVTMPHKARFCLHLTRQRAKFRVIPRFKQLSKQK
jgi:hypothetical protein